MNRDTFIITALDIFPRIFNRLLRITYDLYFHKFLLSYFLNVTYIERIAPYFDSYIVRGVFDYYSVFI